MVERSRADERRSPPELPYPDGRLRLHPPSRGIRVVSRTWRAGTSLRMIPGPRTLAGVHAGYLVATGIWPLLHRRSFEAVTGPKQEFWLVRTVGGLAAATGAALGVSVIRGDRPPEAVTLAISSGVVFGLADIRAARTESLLYLGDVLAQLVLVPAWLRRWERA